MTTMTANSSGQINYPSQPCFLVSLATTASSVTGDGTSYTIAFDTEIYDVGSNFSSTTFTAPRSGKYLFACNITTINYGSSHTDTYINLVTSNHTFMGRRLNGYAATVATNRPLGISFSILADMDASDTAYLTVVVSGGTKTINLQGSSTPRNFFSGKLKC